MTRDEQIAAIVRRVQPTIGHTVKFLNDGPHETIEGRISRDDFETLIRLCHQTAVDVSAIALRTSGKDVVVEAEIGKTWYEVIREFNDGPISHCVHPSGMRNAKVSELQQV